jgi:hypothetical protein
MINNAISENDGDPWYIPKDNVVNAWTSAITLTVGNIDLRDFELERKFADMRHERVANYKKKYMEMWDKGIIKDSNMIEFTSPGLDSSYWDFTQEEKDYYYYSDEKRFPKDPNYDPAKDPNRVF